MLPDKEHIICTDECPYEAVRKHKCKRIDEEGKSCMVEIPGKYIVMDGKGKKVRKVLTKTLSNTEVEQHHRTEIKKMVQRAEEQGLFRASIKFEGEMDDYPNYDFQEAQFMLSKAQNMFEALPSGARKRFNNDPVEFMEFANNPGNQKEMIKMGLAKAIDGYDINGNPVLPIGGNNEKVVKENNKSNGKGDNKGSNTGDEAGTS